MHNTRSQFGIIGYITNLTTRKITYSSIFAGVSAIIVIMLLTYTPFVTIPTIRISFEGMLIKICGYLFGITVGFFSGVLCELLVNLYRPTFFHWAYTLTIILYGVIGGLTMHISSVLKNERQQSIGFFIVLLLMCIVSAIVFQLYAAQHNGVSVYNHNFSLLTSEAFFYTTQIMIIVFLPLFALAIHYFFPSKKQMYKELLPIYFLSIMTGFFITIPLVPVGDSDIYQQPYIVFIIIAIMQTPLNIIGNCFIILIVWKIISRQLKRSTFGRYNTT